MMFKMTANSSTAQFKSATGVVSVQFSGTFDSGTMAIQTLVPDSADTWVTMQDGTFTSGPVNKVCYVGANVPVRLTMSGAGGSLSVAGVLAEVFA